MAQYEKSHYGQSPDDKSTIIGNVAATPFTKTNSGYLDEEGNITDYIRAEEGKNKIFDESYYKSIKSSATRYVSLYDFILHVMDTR